MNELANDLPNDKFQIVTRHAADEIVYPEDGYLGLKYTRDLILIQITWVAGRSTEVKKKLYKQIADEVHTRAGVRKGRRLDHARRQRPRRWSFGNGEMQYAPK